MSTSILAPHNPAGNGGEPQTLADILAAFEDLVQHGEMDAAALALGDAWRLLPAEGRDRAAELVRQLAGEAERLSA